VNTARKIRTLSFELGIALAPVVIAIHAWARW
jgi:hypothetical protein